MQRGSNRGRIRRNLSEYDGGMDRGDRRGGTRSPHERLVRRSSKSEGGSEMRDGGHWQFECRTHRTARGPHLLAWQALPAKKVENNPMHSRNAFAGGRTSIR